MQTVIPDFTWQPSTRERYNDQLNVLFPAEWIGQAPPLTAHDAARGILMRHMMEFAT